LRKPAPSAAPQPQAAKTATADGELAEVQRLADQGHLAEAARSCEAYLKHHRTSAEAVFLLGVVRDAAGNLAEAADLYRKAIYLDPRHHQALAHLALVLDRQGDAAGAKAASDRLSRLDRRGSG
jgi:chemotaxis protein methyltransferase WspC